MGVTLGVTLGVTGKTPGLALLLGLLAACAVEAQPPAPAIAADTARPPMQPPMATRPPPAPAAGANLAALPEARVPSSLPPPKPAVAESYTGLASWYGRKFHGRLTASGDRYDMAALTAAHQTLPFGSQVRVTNLANGRSVVVTINDRGPYAEDRVIDLSHAAAQRLGIIEDGVAEVRLEVLAGATEVAG